ncbi:MAG: hypothetical protein LUI60_00620 [Clostridia bacterium]|nr:hypothetical protein [Clostridia bacterium]
MITKRKYTFDDYNIVLNVCDFMTQEETMNPYKDKDEPSKLKQNYLDYSYIHFTDAENKRDLVTMHLAEDELEEFNFMLGFSYGMIAGDAVKLPETDYVQFLKDKLAQYEMEKRKAVENDGVQSTETEVKQLAESE